MRLRKRPLREFEVSIGDPWTINGNVSTRTKPKEILQEIYEIATHFPITITVNGPNVYYTLEMDELMQTRSVKTSRPESANKKNKELAEIELDAQPVAVAPEPYVSPVTNNVSEVETSDAFHASLSPLKFIPTKFEPRTIAIAAGAAIGLVVLGLIVAQMLGGSAKAKGTGNPWETALPTNAAATQSLDSRSTMKLWTLEPGDADSVSWFAAGIVATNEAKGEISLYSQSDGKRVATYKTGDKVALPKDLRWAAEFLHNGEPAVGLRIADSFVAISAAGNVQQWEVPASMEIKVHGSTPLMTNAATEKDPKKIVYKALEIGNTTPIDLTVNRSLTTRAVDADWIVQMDFDGPIIAMNPVDRSNTETVAHAVNLVAPTDEASFVRHLDAGHGYALALWDVSGVPYIGVHALEGEREGEASSFVKSPFSEGDTKSWTIASGMDLALLGPYAFSLKTGALAEYNPDQDFSRAYGPAAVSIDESDRRTFLLDHNQYSESERIIGFTGQGTVLVRLIDGSVAAYGESGGLL